jgi:cytokinin dehydrogenase
VVDLGALHSLGLEITRDAAAADDFGHVVSRVPGAVVRVGSVPDVVSVVRAASAGGVPLAARGRGHSTFGQGQCDGVVVDLNGLAAVDVVAGERIRVQAGANWRSVVVAALAAGQTPPVLTDYLDLSVGGTLSVGGIGGTSHRYGVQTDNVVELEVVTGDGRVHVCSRSHPLFDAARAGLGQFGVITAATLGLVPAPDRVLRHKLYYPTVRGLLADQRILLRENRFDFLQGEILPGVGGWQYLLEVAGGGDLNGLACDRAETEELAYLDFADRLAPGEAYLRSTGEWLHPHPWWNAFLPDTAVDAFVDRLTTELTVADIGPSGLMLVYPVRTHALTTPYFRVPDEPVVFLVAILRTSPPGDPAALRAAVADNRAWYDRARALGGTAYPISAIPFSQTDWASHFGTTWSSFLDAKQRYDPAHVLGAGQGIFQ